MSQKKLRDAGGVFVAEGPKLVDDLLQQETVSPKAIFAMPEWWQLKDADTRQRLQEKVTIIDEAMLQRISALQTPHGVVAVFMKPVFPKPQSSFILMLDAIQDPGNMGTIVRLADWYNISQIICSTDTVDIFNSKVVQSSMGSIGRVAATYTDLPEFLQQNKLPVYATVLGGKPINSLGTPEKGIIVIGNEGRGISPEVLAYATEQVTIPRFGKAESLNAAVATGIVLSHFIQA